MIAKELFKGTIKTIVLKLLSDQGKMYGYEICQKVKELSDGELMLTEGALYPMLHKMESEGLLKIEKVNIGKRVRKYYKLTRTGKKEFGLKIEEFNNFIQTMKLILNPSINQSI